jgi:hypothetical protein
VCMVVHIVMVSARAHTRLVAGFEYGQRVELLLRTCPYLPTYIHKQIRTYIYICMDTYIQGYTHTQVLSTVKTIALSWTAATHSVKKSRP